VIVGRIVRNVAVAGFAVALATVALELAALSPSGADTQVFTGSLPFTVPAHVCSVTVDAVGGAGGSNGLTAGSAEVGGGGGEVLATIRVNPGDQLQVTVGQAGSPGSGLTAPGGPGFNAGGPGGPGDQGAGGGGGGSSAVSAGGTALVIGGGVNIVDPTTGAANGFNGQPPTANPATAQGQGGFGGNGSGAGGAGGADDTNIGQTAGTNGGASNASGIGGTGGTSGGAEGAGGGGGGFSGGGGGGNGPGSVVGSGSGGGGASVANPAVVLAGSVTFPNPATPNAGNGHVRLSWTADPVSCAPTALVVSPRFTG
jgi:hypothetical protein